MYEDENRTQIKRKPRQERSQARFESVLKAALRLFAARGYESISMREIAREAKMPIASVYQYFPMKLAIVREMWTRYTTAISETLADGIAHSIQRGRDEANHLIGIIIDRMAELQAANPAFIEIWSCVAASMELRALNIEDTLQNARVIAEALHKLHPDSEPSALHDRALIAIEMASATTRLASHASGAAPFQGFAFFKGGDLAADRSRDARRSSLFASPQREGRAAAELFRKQCLPEEQPLQNAVLPDVEGRVAHV